MRLRLIYSNLSLKRLKFGRKHQASRRTAHDRGEDATERHSRSRTGPGRMCTNIIHPVSAMTQMHEQYEDAMMRRLARIIPKGCASTFRGCCLQFSCFPPTEECKVRAKFQRIKSFFSPRCGVDIKARFGPASMNSARNRGVFATVTRSLSKFSVHFNRIAEERE